MEHSLNSRDANSRRVRPPEQLDPAVYGVGQTLVAVCNDPRKPKSFWSKFYSQDLGPGPPPLDETKYPSVTRRDLEGYLQIARKYETFWHDRQSLAHHQFHGAPPTLAFACLPSCRHNGLPSCEIGSSVCCNICHINCTQRLQLKSLSLMYMASNAGASGGTGNNQKCLPALLIGLLFPSLHSFVEVFMLFS